MMFYELCYEFGVGPLAQNHIVHLVNVFIRAGIRGTLPLA